MPNPLEYDEADFTTSSGVVNAEQLRQELADAVFSNTPVVFSHVDVREPGSSPRVRVFFDIVPNGFDTATADSVIAAHTATGPAMPYPYPVSGTFTVPKDQIVGRFQVGKGGAVDFSSIKDAVDAAVAIGVSSSAWYYIEVSPGHYVEDQMTIPTGIYVLQQTNSVAIDGVFVTPSNPATSLFLLAGGAVAGLTVSGVTGSGAACFQTTTPSVANVVIACSVEKCAIGFLASGAGVNMFVVQTTVVINTINIGITEAVYKVDNGATLVGNGTYVVAPSALLPYYAGNPIEKVCHADNGSYLTFVNCLHDVAYKNSNQVGCLADNGSLCSFTGTTFRYCYSALKIGSGGSGSQITYQGSTLRSNFLDFSVQSSTGKIYANCVIDHTPAEVDIVTGGTLTGTFLALGTGITETRGPASYRFPSDRSIDIPEFYHAQSSTGLSDSVSVTDGGGLSVDVGAGSGWVVRQSPDFDSTLVSWSAVSGLALTASATNYIAYDGAGLTGVVATTSAPGSSDILLAVVITDGSGVRFIHTTINQVEHRDTQVYDYLVATRKFATNAGLIASQGSTAVKLEVSSGSYYRALSIISYAGSGGDATWSYFYGTNGATEVPGVSSLNTSQYDSAGTLTAMTSGYFRSDTLVLTSDGRLSLIYGKAEHSDQVDAENEGTASMPSFLEESGFYLALVVVEEGVGIASILDARPKPGYAGIAAGGASVTDHGDLTGLGDDDHTQYLLVGGSRPMGGDLSMGGNSITSVNLVDGVDVSAHASRHNPGGVDALSTAAATTASIGQSNTTGSASSFARSDHTHAHSSAAPVNVTKAANAEGAATTFSRTDHKHDVSTAAPGATGVATASGEGSATTLARSDHTHQSNTAPSDVTKAAAAIGTSGEPARADHKHDVSTASAVALTDSTNAEGTASSLARSDHTHSHGTRGGGNLHSLATTSVDGFLAASDKVKIDNLGIANRSPCRVATTANIASLVGGAPSTLDGVTLAADDRVLVKNQSSAAQNGIYTVTTPGTGADGTWVRAADADSSAKVIAGLSVVVTEGSTQGDTCWLLTTNNPITLGSTALTFTLFSPVLNSTAPTQITDTSASSGTAFTAARVDHVHSVSTGTPATVGTANAAGSASSLSRSDHVHSHGAQTDGAMHAAATTSVAGFLSASDKTKLDGVSAGAAALSTVDVPLTIYRDTGLIGVALTAARADHVHDVSVAAPDPVSLATSVNEGSSSSLARADHKHQANTAPVAVTKAAAAIGTSGEPARADHKHDVSTAAPGAIGVATASGEGSATTLARSDHSHQANTAPVAVTKAAAAIGTSGEPARADHKHDVSTAAPAAAGVGTASSEGTATTLARSDHTHQSNTVPTTLLKSAGAIGTSTEPARADHRHDILTGSPTKGIGGGNTDGVNTSLARSDHDHLIREQGGPTDLGVGVIAAGQVVVRSSNSLVGMDLPSINGMRLTGVSNTPLMDSDNSALSTIYLTPYTSNQISLFNGTSWVVFDTAEVSLAVTGRTTDLPFDIFAYDSSGTVTLEFTNWTNSTTRATALVRQDGVWVRSGATTRRYLGTCRPRSATTYSWVATGSNAPVRFDLWNASNRINVEFDLATTTNTWNYTTATWRQAQASTNYQVDVVAGLQESRLLCILTVTSRSSAAVGGNVPRECGIGFDSTTAPTGTVSSSGSTGNIYQTSTATATVLVPIGRHFAAWLEISNASSTTTWLGDDGGTRVRSGMQGGWVC